MYKKNNYDFLRSEFSNQNIEKIVDWIDQQNKVVNVSINKIPFSMLKKWYFDDVVGNLRHETGRFFSIDGIHVETTIGEKKSWDQPIIHQPEIGFLGFIVKEVEGVLHFLVQAKVEPGNVNFVQLSPTLQATRSNYQQNHGGKKPLYLEYFQNAKKEEVLLDQLQSEQGARFLKKRNRNIIIRVNDDLPVYDNFIWVTLGQIKSLMKLDNIVNMDTRTVISGIAFGSYDLNTVEFFSSLNSPDSLETKFLKSSLSSDVALNSIDEIINILTKIKSANDLIIKGTPLTALAEWQVTEDEVVRLDGKYFKIIGVNVEIGNREVVSWSQPMVEPAQEGLCAFVCKEINGILHFAVQVKLECGNYDVVEFAPTVQTLTGDYKTAPTNSIPFLDLVLGANKDSIYFDTLQSEEGGRFYKEQNRNMIIVAGEDLPNELPENYVWMTLNQLQVFLKFNNYINIQARNLIAAISFC